MNQVTEIPIPAHGDAVLKPGSYHLMLIDLVEPLAEESMVEITLEFTMAGPQTVEAPVLSMPPMGEMEMGDDMGDMDGSMEEDEG